MKRFLVHGFYAFTSGVLMSLILPNDWAEQGWTGLAFVALVPLLVGTYRSQKRRELLFMAVILGTTHAWVGRYWLSYFQDFSYIILIALSVGLSGVNFILLLVIRRLRFLRASSRIWAITWLWVAFEFVRSQGFLADPWALLAYGFGQSRYLIQILDITGPMGLTLLVALSNAILAQWWVRPVGWRRYFGHARSAWLSWIFLMFFSFSYGIWRVFSFSVESEHDAEVILVQQNKDSWQVDWVELLEAHIAGVATLEPFAVQPDIIVSSETTLLGDFSQIMRMGQSLPWDRSLREFILSTHSYHLFGALDTEDQFYYNAAFLVDANAQQVGLPYYKRALIPFAEALPFVEWTWLGNYYRTWFGGDLLQRAGEESVLFTIPVRSGGTFTFGVPICFEDAFPSVTREFARSGAQAIVNITNDSWSQRLSAQLQHMAIGRYRSIETRLPTLRAANSGMTVHINALGEYEAILEPFVNGALAVSLPVVDRSWTIYVRFGEWLSYLAVSITGLYLLMSYRPAGATSLLTWLKRFFKGSVRGR